MAEKLRLAVQSHGFEGPGEVTVSVGVAFFRKSETAESALDRADRALYMAKQQGRNRVVDESVLPA